MNISVVIEVLIEITLKKLIKQKKYILPWGSATKSW